MSRLDSARAISVLADVDPEFSALTETLYGGQLPPDAVWRDAFAKISPDPSDMHIPGGTRRDRRQRAVTAGLSAVGAAAGTAGLAYGGRNVIREGRARTGATARPAAAFRAGWPHVDRFTRTLVPLEVAGLGGELMATRILHRDARRATPVVPTTSSKSLLSDLAAGYVHQTRQVVRRLVPAATGRHRAPGMPKPGGAKPNPMPGHTAPGADQHTLFDVAGKPSPDGATAGSQRGQDAGFKAGQAWRSATSTPGRKAATYGTLGLGAAAAVHHRRGGGQEAPYYPGPTPYYYSKRSEREVEVEWAGTFSKFDTDKRLAFGWASVSKMNGVPVVDRQDDIILPEDIEDAVYHYVQHTRVGGDMHARTIGKTGKSLAGLGLFDLEPDEPRKVADLVESMVFTDEKIEKLGLPDDFPRGWWVGFRYHDDDVWADIKEGRRTGFSIHGKGLRTPVDLDELMYAGAVH